MLPSGKVLQFRPAVDRLDVAKIVAQHAEQLLHVRQAEMLHQHFVDLGRAFVLDGDAVVAGSIERARTRSRWVICGCHGGSS